MIRTLLRLHLTNAGYQVLVAEDALVAGHRGIRHPRNLRHSCDDFEDEAKELGACAFLKKPLFADRLLAAVAGQVEGGRIAL